MSDYPRYGELYSTFRDEILSRNSALDADIVDQPGSIANTFAAAAATLAEECVLQIARTAQDRVIANASGEALRQLAWDFYGLTALDASVARVTLTFTRSGVGGGAGEIPAGSKFLTQDGVEFELELPCVWSAVQTSRTAVARATVAGAAGNVGIGEITVIGQALFDSAIGVTNATVAAGGSDAETDTAFRARIRQYWQVARRGTLAAIEYGAKAVAGVGTVSISEDAILDGTDTIAYVANLCVADASGQANQLLADAVADALDEWRPAGAVVNVYPAITQMEDISVTCSFKAGTDTVAATTRIRDALVAYVNSMRVGEDLLKGALQALVASDRDVAVGTAVVVAPAADVVAASTEVLRTTAARVTVN